MTTQTHAQTTGHVFAHTTWQILT